MNTLKPKIIYGTAWKGERTALLVMNAFLQGFRALDTACQPKHYREDLVGEALERLQCKHDLLREEYYIQTKFTPISGQDLNKPLPYNPEDSVTDQIKSSLATSLRNLRTSYLDSYLLHSPLRTVDATLEANVYDARVLVALGQLRKVQVVQNRWYEGNSWDREVWQYCRDNDIEYQSFWTLTGSPSLLAHPAVLKASTKLDVTPAQVIFKLVQLHGIVPLTGTSSELHMQQDLAAERIALEGVEEEIRIITKFIWG
ncbi:NADP-dependent oxidoreductase domain-containing protein [Pisolithus albus]|nr:NADP-dependent oxidoreductase domain-containing protein [Pisolithus albus]